ncbi:MAG TPA: transposase [Pyrinomonadaceae bacterium]|nr:transposase [Pyrinomonadaceae bacterium]
MKPRQNDPMPSSHISLYFHIVFSTKDRRRLISPDWESRLYSFMGGIIKGLDAMPIQIGGDADHLHVLASLKSKHRLDYFIRDLKADSSEWVHKEITKMFEWQKGYGAFSVSPTAVPSVRNYILNQKEHHRKMDFKTEYVDLLTKAEIEYDERFLW